MVLAPHEQRLVSRGLIASAPEGRYAAFAKATGPATTSLRIRRSAALDLVRITPLMDLTSGRPEITIGMLDGPVSMGHPDLVYAKICAVSREVEAACARADSAACMHGTFVAGILSARRGASAPAICPECTLLVSPIFPETPKGNAGMLSATAAELAKALTKAVDAGAHIINLSITVSQTTARGDTRLRDALDYAASRGALVVAAAGNEAEITASVVTRHPWVIPVAACDLAGRPMNRSNLGHSIGRRGLAAPGDEITSLGSAGSPATFAGTSVAAAFVTGAVALLWSEFSDAPAPEIRSAVAGTASQRKRSLVPPLLDAWTAYRLLLSGQTRQREPPLVTSTSRSGFYSRRLVHSC